MCHVCLTGYVFEVSRTIVELESIFMIDCHAVGCANESFGYKLADEHSAQLAIMSNIEPSIAVPIQSGDSQPDVGAMPDKPIAADQILRVDRVGFPRFDVS